LVKNGVLPIPTILAQYFPHLLLLNIIIMKTRFLLIAIFVFISFVAFCQDSSYHQSHQKVTFKNEPQIHSAIVPAQKTDNSTPTPFYRDTRLGSSSPLYNTYKKNDYGAGAITTNPNKGGSGSTPDLPAAIPDSIKSNL
jgi:hypothetical protein